MSSTKDLGSAYVQERVFEPVLHRGNNSCKPKKKLTDLGFLTRSMKKPELSWRAGARTKVLTEKE